MSDSFRILLTFFLALIFFFIHSYSSTYFLKLTKQKYFWLSFSGGISVSYVFIHIFPELSDAQNEISKMDNPIVDFFDYHIYLISLFGFILFYGLDSAARISKANNAKQNNKDYAEKNVFLVHIVSFAIYNFQIGYFLLHRETPGLESLLFFFAAMATHIMVNDYSLRNHFKHYYMNSGRWILSAAVLLGWLCGVFFDVSHLVLDIMFAFIAGGMILNIIKEELPDERQSKFFGFASGCIVYSALLLIID
jgi:zinc transporter ZupT